ncbi:6-phosphogluconolactonase [Agromyces sp. NPDC058136]|uniref:6-phosphogluconolactonase n=1 Tax=Agromyces sp. NPDC058136 TaxID=3346354 RepID=UPI0036DF240E
MTNERRVLVHPDKATLAGAVAARFITKTLDLLDAQPIVHIVLTGGSMGSAVLEAVAASPARMSIDWSRVHFWWGDERWLPRGDAERNDRQAFDALLDDLDLPADNLHPFPASDSGLTLDEAAVDYAAELADHAAEGLAHPVFDITFLGVGPDGHIASLFPHRSGIEVTDQTVIAVRESPKPPPERLSLTRPVINSSQRVWMVLAGADKASALGLALAGASRDEVPVAGIKGRRRTVFFIDSDAAAEVPEALIARDY